MNEATTSGIPYLARVLPQVVLIADGEGGVHFANERWTEHTGRSLAEAAGADWLDAVHPDDRDRVRAAWEWAVEGDRDHAVDARLTQRAGGHGMYRLRAVPNLEADAGTLRWYLLAEPAPSPAPAVAPNAVPAEPLAGNGAGPRRAPGSSAQPGRPRDVLRGGDPRFEAALRNSPTSVFMQDADLRYRWVYNPYPNFDHQRLLGRTDEEIFDPEDAAALTRIKRRALDEGTPVQEEVEVTIHGERYCYQLYAEPQYDGNELSGLIAVATDVTERKTEAEAVEASEAHLRNVLESLFAFVGVLDRDGTVLFANRAPLEAAGMTFADVEGKKFWDCAWWDYDADVRERLRRACAEVAEGGFVRYDVPVQMAGGALVPIDFQLSPLRDEAGRVTHLIPSAVDITERVEAEASLRGSERRYRTLFESIDQGFCLIEIVSDADGRPVDYRFLETNPAFGRHTGLVDADGATACELIPGLEGHWIETYGRVAATGEPARFVEESAAMGRWFEVEAFRVEASSAVPTEAGRVAILFTDVTDRKRAEEARAESEAQLRTLANAMPQLVWTALPDGTVDYYNERREHYLGISGDASDRYEWNAVLHPDDQRATVEAWEEAIATGTVYEVEHRVRMHGGAYRWHLSRGIPILDDEGAVARWHGTATDIDALKQAEATNRELNETLEARVDEQTAELRDLNARLGERAEDLEEANRYLKEFTYSVSHDLRAPLRAISGFAEILERRHAEALGERGGRYVDNIVTASARMGRLIEDLLQYSRLGRSGVELRPVSLADALADALDPLQPTIEEAGAVVTLPEADVRVLASETLLEQALRNLLSNAIRYHKPDERPLVRVEIEQTGGRVQVLIHDEGIGIAPEHHGAVFQLFQRLHDTEAYPGTGIGLAIVRRAVSLMNGSVSLRSIPDDGSVFTLTLEAADEAALTNK